MRHYGIEMSGEFVGELVPTVPPWTSSDEGRLIYSQDTCSYYYGSDTKWIELSNKTGISGCPLNYISGLTLTRQSDTTLSVAPGITADASNTYSLQLLNTIVKDVTIPFSSGGALDTGLVTADTWYHVFLIARSDINDITMLTSSNFPSPIMPSNYDKYKRIGSIYINDTTSIADFRQNGDEFWWDKPVIAFTGSGPTSPTLLTIRTPPDIRTKAFLSISMSTVHGAVVIAYVYDPDLSNIAVGGYSRFSLFAYDDDNGKGGERTSCWTNVNSQIKFVCNTNVNTYLSIYGYRDLRGKEG